MRTISDNRKYELCAKDFYCTNCICFFADRQGLCTNFCAFMQKFRSGISGQNKRFVCAAGNKINFCIKIRIRDELTRLNFTEYLPDNRVADIKKEAISAFDAAILEFTHPQDIK